MTDGIRRALLRAEPESGRFLAFDDPVESLVARAPGEVPVLLARAEEAAARGLWAVGFVGYEAAPAFDPALVVHPSAAGPAPIAAFSIFVAPRTVEKLPAEAIAEIERRAPSIAEPDHARAVARIREAIAGGDTYQVNLVFPIGGCFSGRPRDLFARLLAPGEAPFAALLEADSWAVVSLSPELFFERDGGRVLMRPMKGTRPRGRFTEEDLRLAAELAASEKDRAENLMIVDMVRNDLGRVADPGSVAVEERFAVERYPTVWQMTSTVAARSSVRLPEIFAALFPCASVTGAPKPSTMRLIRALEPETRGVYCGAIGIVAPGGRARFAVAIRTLELDLRATTFRYGVGSGITWDSDASAEWRECLDKARVLDGAPPEFGLVETMRFRPGRGIELLDLHLERLAASAEYFEFSSSKTKTFIEGGVRAEVLACCAELPPRSHRVRLVLARDGTLTIEASPFESDRRAWRVTIARDPVPSMAVFVFHKTTNRRVYELARASAAAADAEADEVLLVNEHGELTEGTRANLFVQIRGGEWLTPPREAGLLAGVFREHLLRNGRVVEATLAPHDLLRAHRVRLGNALRGWVPIEVESLRAAVDRCTL